MKLKPGLREYAILLAQEPFFWLAVALAVVAVVLTLMGSP